MPLTQPELASSSLAGSAVFSLTVLADGSVGDVTFIGGGASKSDLAIESLKHWKFTPAMCGTEPIVSDIQVVIRSRHI